MTILFRGIVASLCLFCGKLLAASPLDLGSANHAFDHLGSIGDQAEAAAASGANIIYVSGLGGPGYGGLPSAEDFSSARRHAAAYIRTAKTYGIRLAIGYVCATSIVKLKGFDRNWPEQLRSQIKTAPPQWLQLDRSGKPLRSWYGGEYEPACMNNPDWRAYERFIVREQLESGCDGIFFDNPTVHPDGCYCEHCMEAFKASLRTGPSASSSSPTDVTMDLGALRTYAAENRLAFLRFRCTIARDFFADMRKYAHSIKPNALITANNSLNSSEVLFSQCRSYAYNIHEMSKTEDYVVVEDMATQPRILPTGQTIEYGPTYKQLVAISHGKPVVAVTIADADYHTAPDLVRLAMAEAVANGGSYLSWPTWPENERSRMISTIRPQSDFQKAHADVLNQTQPRTDVLVFLPFRQWLETDRCLTSGLCAELSKANIQYAVICEDQLTSRASFHDFMGAKVLLVGSRSDLTASELGVIQSIARACVIVEARHNPDLKSPFNPQWLEEVRGTLPSPSVIVQAVPTLRVLVRDQPKRTIVHLLNLNVQKLSSFTDKVTVAQSVRLSVRVPFKQTRSVKVFTADDEGYTGDLKFQQADSSSGSIITIEVPRIQIASLVVIE
jgi:hypothetical protein